MATWGTPEERERRKRIQIAVAAFAYECMDDPIMDDATYDWLAEAIDLSLDTGHPLLDAFFRAEFSPMSGMWIHQHPEKAGIEQLYRRYLTNVMRR